MMVDTEVCQVSQRWKDPDAVPCAITVVNVSPNATTGSTGLLTAMSAWRRMAVRHALSAT